MIWLINHSTKLLEQFKAKEALNKGVRCVYDFYKEYMAVSTAMGENEEEHTSPDKSREYVFPQSSQVN